MAKIIDVPGVGLTEFPDDMPDAKISESIQTSMGIKGIQAGVTPDRLKGDDPVGETTQPLWQRNIADPMGTLEGSLTQVEQAETSGGGLGAMLGTMLPGGPVRKVAGAVAASPAAEAVGDTASSIGRGIKRTLFGPSKEELVGEVASDVARAAGRPASVAERIAQGEAPVHQAYKAAESIQTRVPSQGIGSALDEAARTVGDPKAQSVLNRLRDSDTVGNSTQGARYADLVKAEQELTDLARSTDAHSGRIVRQARDSMLDQMDQVHPAIKRANDVRRKFTAEQEINHIIEGGVGNTAGKLATLLKENPSYARSLGWDEAKVTDLLGKAANIDQANVSQQARKNWLKTILYGAAAGAGTSYFMGR